MNYYYFIENYLTSFNKFVVNKYTKNDTIEKIYNKKIGISCIYVFLRQIIKISKILKYKKLNKFFYKRKKEIE
jgi:hypothetical protein